jgi:Phage derived protein Gp49-like (DUF891).
MNKTIKTRELMKKFIAYEGREFIIEWYFTARDKSDALEYYTALSPERQKKLINLFRLLGDVGKIFNEEKFRHEDDKIYAFKPQPDRFLCFFFEGSKVVVTNAFEKKTDKSCRREKNKKL